MKIGVVYGNPETTTGGNALKFYATRAAGHPQDRGGEERRRPGGHQDAGEGGEEQGRPAFREAEFEIIYGTGVNWPGEIVDLGSEAGVVEKSGAVLRWKGERIAQGRDNACKWMVENPQAAEEIRALLVARRKAENAKLGAPQAEAAAA